MAEPNVNSLQMFFHLCCSDVFVIKLLCVISAPVIALNQNFQNTFTVHLLCPAHSPLFGQKRKICCYDTSVYFWDLYVTLMSPRIFSFFSGFGYSFNKNKKHFAFLSLSLLKHKIAKINHYREPTIANQGMVIVYACVLGHVFSIQSPGVWGGSHGFACRSCSTIKKEKNDSAPCDATPTITCTI